jgi:hypothetical protein
MGNKIVKVMKVKVGPSGEGKGKKMEGGGEIRKNKMGFIVRLYYMHVWKCQDYNYFLGTI